MSKYAEICINYADCEHLITSYDYCGVEIIALLLLSVIALCRSELEPLLSVSLG